MGRVSMYGAWSTDVWEGLSPYFPTESNKSSMVLITIRNQQIDADAHSYCHKLRLLD